jgi:hypothetical protein
MSLASLLPIMRRLHGVMTWHAQVHMRLWRNLMGCESDQLPLLEQMLALIDAQLADNPNSVLRRMLQQERAWIRAWLPSAESLADEYHGLRLGETDCQRVPFATDAGEVWWLHLTATKHPVNEPNIWPHPEQAMLAGGEDMPFYNEDFTAALQHAWSAVFSSSGRSVFWRIETHDAQPCTTPITGPSAGGATALGLAALLKCEPLPQPAMVVLGTVLADSALGPVGALREKTIGVYANLHLPMASVVVVTDSARDLLQTLACEICVDSARVQQVTSLPQLLELQPWHQAATQRLQQAWCQQPLPSVVSSPRFVPLMLAEHDAQGRPKQDGEWDMMPREEAETREQEVGNAFVASVFWEDVTEQPQTRTVIVGPPGSGKTFATKATIQQLAAAPASSLRPLWIAAKDLPSHATNADEAMCRLWGRSWLAGQLPKAFTQTSSGLFVWPPRPNYVVIDGVDEVLSDLEEIEKWLGTLQDSLGDATLIVTCRTLDWERGGASRSLGARGADWRVMAIQALPLAAQKRFLAAQIPDNPDRLEHLCATLASNAMLQRLGQTAAPLVMLCRLSQDEALPSLRGSNDVHDRIVRLMLEGRWRHQSPVWPGESVDVLLAIIAHVSLRLLVDNEGALNVFDGDAWSRALQDHTLDFAPKLLEKLIQAGLVIRSGRHRGRDFFAFVHRSFAEYLAAKGLNQNALAVAQLASAGTVASARGTVSVFWYQTHWVPVIENLFLMMQSRCRQDLLSRVETMEDDLFLHRLWWLLRLHALNVDDGKLTKAAERTCVEWIQLVHSVTQEPWKRQIIFECLPTPYSQGAVGEELVALIEQQRWSPSTKIQLLARLHCSASEALLLKLAFHANHDPQRSAALAHLGRMANTMPPEIDALLSPTTRPEILVGAISFAARLGSATCNQRLRQLAWTIPSTSYAQVAARALRQCLSIADLKPVQDEIHAALRSDDRSRMERALMLTQAMGLRSMRLMVEDFTKQLWEHADVNCPPWALLLVALSTLQKLNYAGQSNTSIEAMLTTIRGCALALPSKTLSLEDQQQAFEVHKLCIALSERISEPPVAAPNPSQCTFDGYYPDCLPDAQPIIRVGLPEDDPKAVNRAVQSRALLYEAAWLQLINAAYPRDANKILDLLDQWMHGNEERRRERTPHLNPMDLRTLIRKIDHFLLQDPAFHKERGRFRLQLLAFLKTSHPLHEKQVALQSLLRLGTFSQQPTPEPTQAENTL